MKNIYKIGFAAIAVALLFELFSQNTYAAMPSTFRDQGFYDCVYGNFRHEFSETVENGILTEQQLAKMTKLTCGHESITDMTGLELMTSLTELSIYHITGGNTSIDLSKNVNLTELYLFNIGISSIDLSKNINLTEVTIGGDELTSIDLSKNVNLTYLNLWWNSLESIDLSKNTKLAYLDVSYNRLTSIDVSNSPELQTLIIMGNPIENTDLSKNLNLEQLHADGSILIETGITSKKDGDRIFYDFSDVEFLKIDNYSNQWDWEYIDLYPASICINSLSDDDFIIDLGDSLDDPEAEECVFVFEYDKENRRLYVNDFSSTGGFVVFYRPQNMDIPSRLIVENDPDDPVIDVSGLISLGEPIFRLKLIAPEPDGSSDDESIDVPNTGAFPENSDTGNVTFPILWSFIGAFAACLILYSNRKRDIVSLER
ncbi:hypothetical protein IJI29_03680 [Candidatus Saccharibacteria bacterium]|nr:hypothetical protein [Candidatus Saccharibacteria bacterium]